MHSQIINPYESPEEIERGKTEKERGQKHHLSNRVMATVAGTIGALFAAVGLTALLELIVAQPTPPTGSETSFIAAVIISCVILPLLGSGLLCVAVFLWRYDSREKEDDEPVRLPASS